MKITNQQLINPGILDISDEYNKQLASYKETVQRANFLKEKEKRRWTLLGYMLTTRQLMEAEKIIISEDLRVMKIRQELEKIKPTTKHNV